MPDHSFVIVAVIAFLGGLKLLGDPDAVRDQDVDDGVIT